MTGRMPFSTVRPDALQVVGLSRAALRWKLVKGISLELVEQPGSGTLHVQRRQNEGGGREQS